MARLALGSITLVFLLPLLPLPPPLAAPEARACSVCACDPSGGTLGVDRPSAGDLRLSLEARYLEKESGPASEGEGEKEGRTLFRLQYSPIRRLSLGIDLPFYLWKNHYDAAGAMDQNVRGPGDVLLGARFEALQIGGAIPRHTLAVSAAIKAPTGADSLLVPADDGEPDEHKQLGTGSWDGLFGLWYTFGDLPWVAYAGLQARLNGSNGRGFRYGHALFGTLGVRRALLEGRSLYLSLELQARNAGRDRAADASLDPDSGGLLTYATLGAGYQIAESLLVRATVQVPAVQSLNGNQAEHLVGFIGIAYDLSI